MNAGGRMKNGLSEVLFVPAIFSVRLLVFSLP